MARYPANHKTQTRERILQTAGRRFRRDGLDGAGVASLMSDAGLTNGAFYAHFDSKEDLVGEVVAEQVLRQAQVFEDAAALPDGLERVIDGYLSDRHRDDLAGGCVSAALLSDIARSAPGVRSRYTGAARRMIDAFRCLAGLPTTAQDAVVLSRLALLIGSLQLARAIDDPVLRESLLAESRRSVRLLIDSDRSRGDPTRREEHS
ncbi:TetR/AcrR family transcriptional regulator [Microbacterium ureisolvens]|uniref:TetR/AcrR family transcriptional regulator n=1 Tax=Microbacterium ureisolvens TaxID=2781186 RepID=A0ABS7I1F6_9MICO|nr:TetR/AcrR family transcriptional regulator [Microbacterium ureisolvens]MBW9111501.1 TetR/AcrR family transcriptional regulator [Microbacterium ureisolvens]